MKRTRLLQCFVACLLGVLLDGLIVGNQNLAQPIGPGHLSADTILPVPSYSSADELSLFKQSYFDLLRDHNQTLDAYRELVAHGQLAGTPRVLVHFDYHADLYRNNQHRQNGFEGIGNYINALVSDGAVNEIWWIVPDATETPAQSKFFWEAWHSYSDWQFRDGPADQSICVNRNGDLAFGAENMTCSGRKVPFHKRTLRMLEGTVKHTAYEVLVPEGWFADRDVLLDFDADFFDYNGIYANRGYGSEPRLYQLVYTPERLNHEFGRVLKALNRVALKPVLTACAMSPEYTNAHAMQIEVFFRYLGIYSRTGTDYIVRYAHTIRRQDSHRGGKNVLRGIDAQIYYDLMTADRILGRQDRIDFRDGDRTTLARTLVMNNLNWSAEMAEAKLKQIARSQNHVDYIDLAALSQFDDLRP